MDNSLDLRRISSTITTGIPQEISVKTAQENSSQSNFRDVLLEKMNSSESVNFSKHAMNRVMERNIDLSESSLSRLNEGIKLAEEKGLDDTLILMDSNAFIVSVKNNTVITTVSNDELKGNVFTNIDGTVII